MNTLDECEENNIHTCSKLKVLSNHMIYSEPSQLGYKPIVQSMINDENTSNIVNNTSITSVTENTNEIAKSALDLMSKLISTNDTCSVCNKSPETNSINFYCEICNSSICSKCSSNLSLNSSEIQHNDSSEISDDRLNEIIFLQLCTHFFCKRCLINICLQNFMSEKYDIKCPNEACDKKIDFEDIIKIIDSDINLYTMYIENVYTNNHKNDQNEASVDNNEIMEIIPGYICENTKNDPNCNSVCDICGDDFYINQFHFIDNCEHLFCIYCYEKYVQININEGNIKIKCMHKDCNKMLTHNDITKITINNNEMNDKYERFLFQENVEDQIFSTKTKRVIRKLVPRLIHDDDDSDNEDSDESEQPTVNQNDYIMEYEEITHVTKIVRCPACGIAIEIDYRENSASMIGGNAIRCVNSKCKNTWCTNCKILHSDQTCDTYLKLLKATNFDEWREIKGDTVKECPTCDSIIEKTSGCSHMTCKKCKGEFCWDCGTVKNYTSSWKHPICSKIWKPLHLNKSNKPDNTEISLPSQETNQNNLNEQI